MRLVVFVLALSAFVQPALARERAAHHRHHQHHAHGVQPTRAAYAAQDWNWQQPYVSLAPADQSGASRRAVRRQQMDLSWNATSWQRPFVAAQSAPAVVTPDGRVLASRRAARSQQTGWGWNAAWSQPPVYAAQLAPAVSARAAASSQYNSMVARHAAANGLPEALVHRVIVRESGYNPRIVGSGGAMGMMQIKLATARSVGYTGSAAGLLDPETNLTYAVRYLAGAYQVAGGNADRAVSHYARGYYYAAKRQGMVTSASAAPFGSSAPYASAEWGGGGWSGDESGSFTRKARQQRR